MTEYDLNKLASGIAVAARRIGSPIGAYHARADLDEMIRLNPSWSRDQFVRFYSTYYGVYDAHLWEA